MDNLSDENTKNRAEAGRSGEAETSPLELEAAIYRQEHRLITLCVNFFRKSRKYEEHDIRRKAIVLAFFWNIVPALIPTAAAAGIGVTGTVGLYFAYRANSLIGEQNVLLASQNQKLDTEIQLLEASRRSALVYEVSSIQDEITQLASESPGLSRREIHKITGNSGGLTIIFGPGFLMDPVNPNKTLSLPRARGATSGYHEVTAPLPVR